MAEDQADYSRDYNPLPIASSLSNTPRFGHPRDFSLLFSEESGDANSYVYGLLFVGCITFSLFATWGLLLCVFRCIGPGSVGYFSGAPFTFDGPNPADSDADEQPVDGTKQRGFWNRSKSPQKRASNMYRGSGDDASEMSGVVLAQDVEKARKFGRRNKIIRIVFIINAMIFAVCSILAVSKGVSDLQNTVNIANQNAENIDAVAKEAREIIQVGLRDTAELARSVRASLRGQLASETFCPSDPNIENSDTGKKVFGEAQNALQLLDALDDFRLEPLSEIEETLDSVEDGSSNLQQTTGDIDLLDWEAMIIVIPYVIVPCIFIAACVMAMFDVSVPSLNKCVNWFLVPLFIIMTVIAVLLASGMIMGAGITADFCLPGGRDSSPDITVRRITEQYGYADTLVFDVVNYYVSQCGSDDPFGILKEYQPQVESSLLTLQSLDDSFKDESTIEELALYCNRDFEPVEQVVSSMSELLGTLSRSLVRTLNLLDCDVIVPIYTSTVYDATCTYSMSAVFWIFSCAILLSVSGLIMLTLRSAIKQDIYTETYESARMDDSDEVSFVVQEVEPHTSKY